jgi:hypothetical protein
MTQEKTSPMVSKIVEIIANRCGLEIKVNCLDCGFDAGCGVAYKELLRPLAKQIIQELLKWLKEPCPHDIHHSMGRALKHECRLCLEELKRMVGE